MTSPSTSTSTTVSSTSTTTVNQTTDEPPPVPPCYYTGSSYGLGEGYVIPMPGILLLACQRHCPEDVFRTPDPGNVE
jgi:hypothetical protein